MSRDGRKPLQHRRVIVGFALLASAVVVGGWWWSLQPTPEELLVQARAAFDRKDFADAEQLAARIPPEDSRAAEARVIAGDAAAQVKEFERAVSWYAQVPDDGAPTAISALISSGLVHRELGHAADAEQCLRRALAHAPDSLPAHNALAHLLGVEGRSWEAVPHFLEPVRQGRFSLNHLLLLGSVAPIVQDDALIERCRHARPDDPLPLLGRARMQLFAGTAGVEPRRIFEQIARKDPEQAEAQARLGQQLADANDAASFLQWHQALPASVDAHPEIWAVRGAWARRRGELPAAVRCYVEAVLRDPDHQTANHQAGQTLVALGTPEKAQPFLDRAALLSELTGTTGLLQNEHRPSPERVRRAAELTERLGRLWEARGWCRVALAAEADARWAAELEARIAPRLTPELGRTVPDANPAARFDLSAYPLPAWNERATDDAAPVTSAAAPALAFHDRAQAAGIDFRFFNGASDDRITGRMQETTGGGVAALDFDCDSRSDLYFTQGCAWPPGAGETAHTDRLFRNQADGRARDVTAAARLGETGFSQGVAAGDVNSDGFPDLYVANIGANVFYMNNGDGTFTDVTRETSTAGDRWSTSCALADLDGDALPDLYVVNYLQGDDVFTKVCTHQSGIVAGCGPEHFDAAQDQLYRNLGDGRFEEVTAASGIVQPNGKGLGLVVADFAGRGLPDVFVANDGTANFHFANRTQAAGMPLTFTEQAVASGLAFDWQGRAQAGMGVAAGDADGDGRLDLFVTNYYLESNTLYRQHSPESFEDRTRTAGLSAPSLPMLGFGTQFLDADLDGAADLVVANGHVHQLTAAGIPYAMPPQLFRNRGDGRFEEARPAGDYFAGRFRGRGLARLDWNHDLVDDFAVSHLDSPAALVLNETPQTGQVLSLRLSGAACNRDATGAVVVAEFDGRSVMVQQTAGDGYQCSNERRLTIGLGSATSVDRLTVRWPGGAEQIIRNVPAGRSLGIVEGRAPLELP